MDDNPHPRTYTLDRGQWEHLNRTLAGASLSLSLPDSYDSKEKRLERLARVRLAQEILDTCYREALEAGQ